MEGGGGQNGYFNFSYYFKGNDDKTGYGHNTSGNLLKLVKKSDDVIDISML